MSTEQEKLESIKHAVETAKRRLEVLDQKKKDKTMTRAELFERDMTLETIRRGEEIIVNAWRLYDRHQNRDG